MWQRSLLDIPTAGSRFPRMIEKKCFGFQGFELMGIPEPKNVVILVVTRQCQCILEKATKRSQDKDMSKNHGFLRMTP